MSPHERFEAIAATPTQGVAERAVLLAALYWVNADGMLWPSMENWARLAGLHPRTCRRVIGRLVERGLLRVVRASRGGPKATTRYEIAALSNPGPGPRLQPGWKVPGTRVAAPHNPGGECSQQGPTARGTTKNNQENNQQQGVAAVDVFSQLGIEHLRDHPNATPDRLAWIEREAPGMDSPGGFAAACIRGGWAVPAPTKGDAKAARKAAREATLARFDALPGTERATVLAAVRTDYPNLASHSDDSPAVRGAVAKVLDAWGGRVGLAGGAA